jgi:hypothetical protein
MVCEYGWFKVHVGSGDAVVMVTTGFTVTLNALLPAAPTLSVAVTLKLYGVAIPTDGAVPLSPPAADKVSHAGRFPLDQVTAPVPPLEAHVRE